MTKNHKNNKEKFSYYRERPAREKSPLLTDKTKRWIRAIIISLFTIIVVLSFPFLNKAGYLGEILFKVSYFLIGNAFFTLPLFLIVAILIFLRTEKKGRDMAMGLAILVSLIGIAGLLGVKDLTIKSGGWIGFLMAKLLVGLFGSLVANIVFSSFLIIAFVIFFQFVGCEDLREKEKDEKEEKISVVKKSLDENLKIKGIELEKEKDMAKQSQPRVVLFKKSNNSNEKEEKVKFLNNKSEKDKYILPPFDLLDKNEVAPTSGNIKENSLIIKNTLENFGIPVEMAEVNIGPTVTQYAFKPAEGVKLSKITTLANNLALALAAHPIRIEAPIPGKSLVGIEVPNKVRSVVSLRNLLTNPSFQNSNSPLLIALGRNVSGTPVYTDITDGPHVLVAGATGTGKTIFLNTLILSLLYRCPPSTLRLIMVDPKRVEFQNYNDIPHLLCPVIYDANQTINALQWLVKEMERRFKVLSEIPTRNIFTYNQNKNVIAENKQLPYIVFIVDELADLMAAKGREIETGVVRLAQMARATGIHLVLATQRPSVEVITGLIKANIPTRITFQVASQVDSRTVLDVSGAEKLLGAGDMLFLSSKSAKLTRIQAPYVSEKELKRVADFISKQKDKIEDTQLALSENLKQALKSQEDLEGAEFFGGDDPLFEEAKNLVVQFQKASASFLQRRLRIGYARAARLIDMLEEEGIIGPAEGAKPREVLANRADLNINRKEGNEDLESDGWTKV